jgi:cytochrome d ubiquinol oxidase subunit I
MEAHWERDTGASPLTVLAWPDSALQVNQFAVTVPKLMSWLATHSDESPAGVRDLVAVAEESIGVALREGVGPDGEGWRQLHARTAATRTDWNRLSPETQVHATALASVPSVPTLFAGFRMMVGSAFILAVVLGWALVFRRQVLEGSEQRPLRLLLLVLPLPWLATFAGWTVAEVGRQPWVIYEQLTTASAARLQPAPGAVAELLIYFAAYSLLAMLFSAVGAAILRAGPRRRLLSSSWRLRLRSLFGSRLQRRIAAAARASAWNGRPTPARLGRKATARRHRPADPGLSRS